MRLNKKQKKVIWIVMWGHVALWSLFFLGISVFHVVIFSKQDIFLTLMYALISFALLGLFSVGFKQLPFKKTI